MMTTVSAKGQVVIPAAIRRKLGLRRGSRLLVADGDGDIVLHPLMDNPVEDSFGMFKNRPSAGSVLLAARKAEQDEG